MNKLQIIALGAGVRITAQLTVFALLSVVFAGFGRLVRGVTLGGAIGGCAVCFVLLYAAGWGGFGALATVFLLTWVGTRVGYSRKQHFGTAERRTGRNAGQVLANLGAASAAALLYVLLRDFRFLAGMAGALAEAAGDTVSSEIGQALGGKPRLVTTFAQVAPGTDGAVTPVGTALGLLAILVVAAVCGATHVFPFHDFVPCAVAATLGMFADSLLGATAERRGWMGNNSVNFLSTVVAAGLAFVLS